MASYRLQWLEHWSDERGSADPRVITRYTGEHDGAIEHEQNYYFMALDNEAAIKTTKEYIDQSSDNIEVFNLLNRDNKRVILTEEVTA